jgi:uncharacterized protein (DUF305 family)
MFNNPTIKTIFNYLSYLALFVGTGFISGAIVHSGKFSDIPKYIAIGLFGVVLFAVGSLTQEILSGKHTMNKLEATKFFLFSLFLSIGIGMISGGFQHFTDFPAYSSYLIPIGFLLSWLAFLLKNNSGFNPKILATTVGILVLCLPLYFGLNAYAKSLAAQNCNSTIGFLSIKASASEGHSEDNCNNQNPTKVSPTISKSKDTAYDSMVMKKPNVVDDKTFIEYVIPHHQDALDNSQTMLKFTKDPELIIFLNNVIKNQGNEIETLRGYYKTWFGKEYVDTYNKPIQRYTGMTSVQAEKEYITGMLGHHNGIIDIAKMVLTDSKFQYKPEILELSKQIIKDQEADNIILKKWLTEKYGVKSNFTNEIHDDSDGHTEGH